MKFKLTTDAAPAHRAACVAVPIFEADDALAPATRAMDDASGGVIARLVASGDVQGKLGQTRLLHALPNIHSERVLLVGCGKRAEFNATAFRKAAAAAVRALGETAVTAFSSYLPLSGVDGRDAVWALRMTVEASEDAMYRFDRLKSEKKERPPALQTVTLAVAEGLDARAAEQALADGAATALGVALAKDLGNLPGNVCTPTYLAEQARQLGNAYGFQTTILDEAEMEKLGMGALLSVARGSRQPAKLIVMEYRGADGEQPPIALVGKGLTFDAGGISIKPAAAMDEMKYDMCGGASVLGALKAAAELKLPVNIVGIIPSSENLPDGNANKPGDIVTSMSGQSIEVLNTDAEGRLILCDALTYAQQHYRPAVAIDIATLTGACVIALGAHASGLLANDDGLAEALLQAGVTAHDRAWRLPLWDDYQEQLDSNFADMANVGGREAGTITAACFLARYAKGMTWAHLDIAGTAWKSGKEKGATGRPVPLLVQYLIGRARG